MVRMPMPDESPRPKPSIIATMPDGSTRDLMSDESKRKRQDAKRSEKGATLKN